MAKKSKTKRPSPADVDAFMAASPRPGSPCRTCSHHGAREYVREFLRLLVERGQGAVVASRLRAHVEGIFPEWVVSDSAFRIHLRTCERELWRELKA